MNLPERHQTAENWRVYSCPYNIGLKTCVHKEREVDENAGWETCEMHPFKTLKQCPRLNAKVVV